MIKLEQIKINKYKCFNEPQMFDIDSKITVLVGMNESGKSAILEAVAKTNYFDNDKRFKYDFTLDYPRKDLTRAKKSREIATVIESKYSISKELKDLIEEDLGPNVFVITGIDYNVNYNNESKIPNLSVDSKKFLENKLNQFEPIIEELREEIIELNVRSDVDKLLENDLITAAEVDEKSQNTKDLLDEIQKYFEDGLPLNESISKYVEMEWIRPHLPKYMYYDEYYTLPSRVDIADLGSNDLDESQLKTTKALFELAGIDVAELIQSEDFERHIAELESTSIHISEEIFKYWTTNKNLSIEFKIDRKKENEKFSPILDIRVKNAGHGISLPLKNRSKGFNWFFSFIVWFSKIQEDEESKYILLLDEPGLNLHASAQADLLRFIEDLSTNYQIIYTTHSPFMVDSRHLERVRTVVETENGTKISDTIQEKDPNTLFPLQAALGYDIAQNLFISKNNLLVEGPADLLYLTIMSSILESEGRECLNKGITIVPVGGLDKVSTFISLLRGNKLDIVCLLDSYGNSKGKQKVDDLIKQKIIKQNKIRYFHEFASIAGGKADIEDLFEKEEYLTIFNRAFTEHPDISISDLNSDIRRIVLQISDSLDIDEFNHYRPANKLAQMAVKKDFFSDDTLNRFESIFKEVNKLFS
jgi:predicted ATP-dependent endonuclease of OLD family